MTFSTSRFPGPRNASRDTKLNVGLRGILFCFTIISLGIEGHLRATKYNIARVNLGIAASVIGLVLSVFVALFLLFTGSDYSLLIQYVLDSISFSLYLSASASLTKDRGICHSRGQCSQFRAGIAFLFMDWIILLFAMGLEYSQYFSEQRGLNWRDCFYRGPKKSTAPNTQAHHTGPVTTATTATSKEAPDGFIDREADVEPSPVSGSVNMEAPEESGQSTSQAHKPTEAV